LISCSSNSSSASASCTCSSSSSSSHGYSSTMHQLLMNKPLRHSKDSGSSWHSCNVWLPVPAAAVNMLHNKSSN
jgi:hypothetical protein